MSRKSVALLFLVGMYACTAMGSNGVPNLLPFQGRVTDTSGNPINYPVTINFRIYPPTGSCYLYEDTESVTPDSYGMFSVTIGTNSTGPANTLAQVFSNDGGTISNSCSGTYSPGANDWRLLQLVVDGTPLPQMETIGSSGFALNAFNLDGKDAASFIQVSGVVTQAALNTLISNGPYMQANGNTSTTGSVTTGGNIYVPGASGSIGIGTSTTTADLEIQKTAPSFLLDAASGGGGTDTVNFSSGTTQLGAIQAQDGTTGLKFYSGSSLAMSLDSSQNLILNGSLSVAGTVGLGKYTGAQETSLISTLSGMGLTATGTMWVNTTTNQLRYWDGSAAETIVSSANQNANLIYAGPSSGSAAAPTFRSLVAADLPASGVSAGTYKSVAVDTYGRVTAGTNPTSLSGYGITDAVQNGGGAPGMMAGLDASKPATPAAGTVYFATDTNKIYEFNSSAWSLMASAVGSGGTVTNVSSSTTDINVANGATTPVLTLNSGTGANQIVKLNGSAQLPAVDGSQLTNLNASSLASGTIAAGRMPAFTGDVTSAAGSTVTTVATVGGSTAANVHAAEMAANAATSADTVSTIVKRDASGRTNFGGLVFDGSTSGTVTVNPPSSATSYTMNLPAAQGSANTFLKNDGAGNLSWSSVTSGTVTSVATGTGLTGGPITSSGTISLAPPTTSTIGGVEAVTPVAHDWVNSITTSGVPQLSQPAFSDLTGTVTATQMPALTGDVTSTAGSTATTVAKIEGTSVDTAAPTSAGQVLRYDGTSKYVDAFIGIADIRSTASGNAQFFPTTCTSGQTLTYSSPTDTFVCTNIAVAASNFGSQSQATFLAAPTGAAGAPTFRNIASSDLPASGVATGTYKSVTVDSYGRVTGGTNPTTLAGYGITDSVQNAGGTPGLETGLDASKPAFPSAGTVYFATDTKKVYQYNSGAWSLMASAAGSGGTVTSVATGTGLTGGPITGSGTISLAAPTTSAIGGVEAITPVSHEWVNSINTSGVPQLSQPAFSDLTGTPTTLSGYGITDSVQNAGGAPSIESGLEASKPAAPTAGSIYLATDTNKIYQYNSGAWAAMGGTGNGTVTSVGLSDGSTAPLYSVSGSPVTTSGTLSFTLNTQAKNTVLAGPTTGSNAQPTFRGLVAADLPTSGVTAGTYNSVTVDTYGRVTAGANPTTLSGYGITDGMQNLGGSPGVETGLDAGKPASPGAGTIYMATDTKKVYQYNSGAWTMMASAAGSGGTVTSITAGTGLTGGTITGSGTIALATPSATTLGGVESIAPVSHEWINSISTSGVPSLSQPSFSDLTGTVAATQMPALTGDVTSTAGSTATTVAGIQGVSVNSTAPTTSGQVLRYDTTTSKYVPNFLGVADIRSTVSGNAQFFPTNCTSGQTLTYSSPTDTYVCTTISVSGTNFGSETANTFLAAPNGSAGNPTFRTIAAADLPASGVSAGTYKSVTVDTTGRVTAGTNPTTLSGFGITDGVQNVGGTPGIDTGADASKPVSPSAGTVYMATDTKKIYQFNSGAWSIMSGSGAGGSVTSVGLSDGSTTPIYTVSGSPVTTSGTLSFTLNTQAKNTVLAGPTTGSNAQPAFRGLVAADLPTSGVTAGTYNSVTVDTYGRVTTGANPTTLSGYGITDGMQNLGGSPGVETGADASKPASPGAGTIYMATDTKKVYQYNSGAWTMMASAAGSGGTVTSITAGTGLSGGTITGSGTIALATPTTSAIGGVEAITPVSHEWINSISTSGVPSLSQPSFSDLTGTVAATQMPALTGDVTSTAGSTATTVVGIQGVSVNSTAPTTSGQVLRYDTTTSKYVPNFLGVADIRSTVTGNAQFFPTNCTSGQTLIYSSPTDTFSCTNIAVGASNFSSQTQATFLAAPANSAGSPTFRNIASTDLPTSGVATGTYKSVTVDSYGRVTGGTNPTTLATFGITDGVQNAGGTPAIETGVDSSKPSSPSAGTIYMATDTKKVYQYNSSAWSMMASAVGSGGTVTSVATGTGLTGGPISSTGTISLATPTTSAIGGVEAVNPVSHEWINSISTSGVPALSQPSFSDITGSVTATQMPALTGDVTSSAGSTATTVGKIQGKAVASTAPTDAQIFAYNNSSSQWAPVSVSGDATIANSGALTLASTGVTAASYGTATAVPTIAVDAKGRITSASNTNIQTATTGQQGLMQVGSGLNVASGVVSLNTTGASGAFVNGGNAFGSAATLGTTDSNSLSLQTNGASAVTIDTSQNVGIGTSTLTEKLNVNGNTRIQGQAYSPSQTSSATSPLTFDTNSGNTMVWSTGSQSSVTANIWNMKDGATYTLILRGTGTGSTTINCYSDSGTTSMTSSFMPANASVVANATIYTIMSAGGYCYISWTTGWN